MELVSIGTSGRKKELAGLLLSYIGDDVVNDMLLAGDVVSEITGLEIQAIPDDGTAFLAPTVFSGLRSADMPPGQTAVIGQTGYKLVIFQYSFSGALGGHSGSHPRNYTNGLPSEWRARDGQSRSITIGPACGILTERITVYTHDGQMGTAGGEVRVIIRDLQELAPASDYVLIGQRGEHPSNHWGTAATIQAIERLCRDYRAATGDRLYINDMSLSWGGIFDIGGGWTPPHHEHRDGNQVDVAATAHTLRYEAKFLEIMRRYTTNYILEGSDSRRHYHVRF